MMQNCLVIVQARTGSTRLPGKVLARIEDHSLLEYVLLRCMMSRRVSEVVLATTLLSADDPVAKIGQALGLRVFRGSEPDVLERYVQAAETFGAEVVVRITADCHLSTRELLMRMLTLTRQILQTTFTLPDTQTGLGQRRCYDSPLYRKPGRKPYQPKPITASM
ncbi:MAG: hypothetical protein PHI06_11395 [Desulfobulbaceae bacterium]|nr:hypothetical protein [Desulfobulbaceae bacterium]